MIRKHLYLTVIAILTVLGTLSCTGGTGNLEREVARTAAAINEDFVSIRDSTIALAHSAESNYARPDAYDISAAARETSAGGWFQLTADKGYYHKTIREGACYYCSPMGPVSDSILGDISAMIKIETNLIREWAKNKDIITAVFFGIHEPLTISMFYPWFDIVSLLPKGIHAQMLEFYKRGLDSTGPAAWASRPFTDLANGWIMDVSVPVDRPGKSRGVASISVSIDKISHKHIEDNQVKILLLDADLTLLSLSKAARGDWGLVTLKDFDYIRQMRENTFAPGKFRLNDNSQHPDIRALAEKLKSGERSFRMSVMGSEYSFRVSRLAEVDLLVVGYMK